MFKIPQICRSVAVAVAITWLSGPVLLVAQDNKPVDSQDAEKQDAANTNSDSQPADSNQPLNSDSAASDSQPTAQGAVPNNSASPFGAGFGGRSDGSFEGGYGGGYPGGGGFGGMQNAKRNMRYVQSKDVMISWSKDHDVLNGYSQTTGRWSSLPIPRQETVVPIVGDTVAAVPHGRIVYAYSGPKGRWDRLELPEGFRAIPSVDHDMVMVNQNDHLYTFSASSGAWTSPTDPSFQEIVEVFVVDQAPVAVVIETLQRMLNDGQLRQFAATGSDNRITVRASQSEMDRIRKVIRRLNESRDHRPATVDDPAAAADLSELRNQYQQAEVHTLELAKQIRDQKDQKGVLVDQLQEAVENVFELRMQIQQAELDRLRAKLQSVERSLEGRRNARRRIIDRRVEELVNPDVNWDQLTSRPQRPSPNTVAVVPVTGTPIGLVGPPQLPLGGPGPAPQPAGAPGKVSLPDTQVTAELDSPIGMARELANHRRNAYQMIEKIQSSLRDLEATRALQRKLDNGTLQESSLGYIALPSYSLPRIESQLQQQRIELQNALAEWKIVWRVYESNFHSLELDLQDAKIAMKHANDEFGRKRQLAANGVESQQELADALAGMERAEIQLARADEQLALYKSITADSPGLNPSDFEKQHRELIEGDAAESDAPDETAERR
jgi:hypothetical protein